MPLNMLPSGILEYKCLLMRYEQYGDGALNRSSQPAAHLAWTETIRQHTISHPTDPNTSWPCLQQVPNQNSRWKWRDCRFVVIPSKYIAANQHHRPPAQNTLVFQLVSTYMFKLKWHSASGTLSALHGHPLAKPVRVPAHALRRCIVAIPARVQKQSLFHVVGNKSTPTTENWSTNPQTLNPLSKEICSTYPCCANSSSRLECNLFRKTCSPNPDVAPYPTWHINLS